MPNSLRAFFAFSGEGEGVVLDPLYDKPAHDTDASRRVERLLSGNSEGIPWRHGEEIYANAVDTNS